MLLVVIRTGFRQWSVLFQRAAFSMMYMYDLYGPTPLQNDIPLHAMRFVVVVSLKICEIFHEVVRIEVSEQAMS